jgi:hypothetical protein
MVGKVFNIRGVLSCLEEELHCSVDSVEEIGSKAGYRDENVGESNVLVEVIEDSGITVNCRRELRSEY